MCKLYFIAHLSCRHGENYQSTFMQFIYPINAVNWGKYGWVSNKLITNIFYKNKFTNKYF